MSPPICRSSLLALAVFLIVLGCDSGSSEEGCEPGPIPGQYNIMLVDTVSNVSATAHRLVDEVDGEIITIWTALKGFAIKGITEQDAQKLRTRPSVELVEQDECFKAFTGEASRRINGRKTPPHTG